MGFRIIIERDVTMLQKITEFRNKDSNEGQHRESFNGKKDAEGSAGFLLAEFSINRSPRKKRIISGIVLVTS